VSDWWREPNDLYFDFNGEPMSPASWGLLMSDPARLLKQEWILGRDCRRFWISTVWMGIDHNFAGALGLNSFGEEVDTRPWIFETMAFRGVAYWPNDVHARIGDEEWQERWATEEEALAGHDRIVAKLKRS
jgi:hypothetical protein